MSESFRLIWTGGGDPTGGDSADGVDSAEGGDTGELTAGLSTVFSLRPEPLNNSASFRLTFAVGSSLLLAEAGDRLAAFLGLSLPYLFL